MLEMCISETADSAFGDTSLQSTALQVVSAL